MAVDWSYFDRFKQVNERYLPDRGEGSTMATQTVTAVNKLVYKWYNDGDVYDNTHSLSGWCNDLSSYANWLYANNDERMKGLMLEIYDASSESDYEDLLKKIVDLMLDEEDLEKKNNEGTRGSIYECDGPFQFVDYCEEDEDY